MSEQEVQEAEVEEQEEETPEVPDGKKPVDFAKIEDPELRAEIQARFRRVYGNMKQYERITKTLEADHKTLSEKLERLETAQVQDRTEQRIEGLKAQTQAAIAEGDIDKAQRLQDELSDFLKESIATVNKRPEPQPTETAYFSPEIQTAVIEWANELDENGDFKRAWAQPGHGKYNRAVEIADEVLQSDDWAGRMDEAMALVDRRINAELFPAKKRTDTVLGADTGVTPTKDTGGRLSADQKEAAHFLYPKLSEKEAEARYAKALKEG